MNNDISLVFEGIGSVGAFYISNAKTANNTKILEKHNIKAVITVTKGNKIIDKNKKIQKYLYLQIENKQDFPIERYFQRAFEFIDDARKSSNILIHCEEGNNHSVIILIAYLIRRYHYSLPQIYTLIKRKRQKIEPYPSFMKKLQVFSKKYSISNNQPNVQNDLQKLKFKRANSLNISHKQSLKHLLQNYRLTTSDVLKETNTKNHSNDQLSEQEKQKITSVLRQRQQIQYKLRNLRHGLIRGRNIKNLITTNQKLKPSTKNQISPYQQKRQDMSENKNPNEQQLQNKKLKISNEAQQKIMYRRIKRVNFLDAQLTQSIELKQ